MERARSGEIGQLGRRLLAWLAGLGGLGVHVGLFVSAASVLALLNVALSNDRLWFWRPLAWWGLLLVAHGVVAWRGAFGPRAAGTDVEPAARGSVGSAGSRFGRSDEATPVAVPTGRRLTEGVSRTIRRVASLRSMVPWQRSERPAAEEPVSTWSAAGTRERVTMAGGGQVGIGAVAGAARDSLRRAGGRLAALARGRSSPGDEDRQPEPAAGSWPTEWRPAVPAAPNQAGPTTARRSDRGAAGGERVPAAVEALWASGRGAPGGERALPERTSAPPRPPRATSVIAVPRPAAGEDRLVQGSTTAAGESAPADWRSLEQEAAAWLTQRQADVAPRGPALPERDAERWIASGD